LLRSGQWSVNSGQYSAPNSTLRSDQYSAANSTPTTSQQLTTDYCPLTTARAILPAPVPGRVFAVDSRTITATWSPVTGASSYAIRIASDQEMTNILQSPTLPANCLGVTLTGLEPGTTYWVAVRAGATSPDTNSAYCAAVAVATPATSQSGTVGDLQTWFNDLQTLNTRFRTLLQYSKGEVLSRAQRKRLLGSGTQRYGYTDKLSDIATEYPQFWPAFVTDDDNASGAERLKNLLREIEVLRNLVIAFRFEARTAEDMLLIASSEAFRLANVYYRNVRDGARSNIAQAAEVFRMLKQFWHRRRRATDQPTEQEVEHDFHALEHGTADGSLYIANESDTVVKGKKTVIDNVVPKRRRAVAKVEEQEEIG